MSLDNHLPACLRRASIKGEGVAANAWQVGGEEGRVLAKGTQVSFECLPGVAVGDVAMVAA
jgi:hypothetical protein